MSTLAMQAGGTPTEGGDDVLMHGCGCLAPITTFDGPTTTKSGPITPDGFAHVPEKLPNRPSVAFDTVLAKNAARVLFGDLG